MPVVMEISFYHYYSGKSLMRLQSRDCTFVQKAGFSLQFHCSLTVKVCSVLNSVTKENAQDVNVFITC